MSRLLCATLLVLCVLYGAFAMHHIDPLRIQLLKKQAIQREKAASLLPNIPKAHFFTQKLDHFNHQDLRTWSQRYFVNDTFWTPGGPIFLQIGGEGAISPAYVLTMEYVEYAKTYGALIVALEHRFYGQSKPLPNLSIENLEYLSSQQALADVAYFLSNFKYSTKGAQDSQVITFGCSYPGALTAWFREVYPFHTSGSVASSAPVNAQLDFYQYLDVVDESLTTVMGPLCDSRIQEATDQVQQMLQTSSGRSQLQTMFKTCTPLDNDLDITTFMSDLMGNWQGTVQYNDETPSYSIVDLCTIMENTTISALDAYVEVNNYFLEQQKVECLSISYQDMIKELQNTVQTPTGVGIRQWTYQSCFEFGFFQTTDSPNQPFGNLVPISYWLQMCNDTFNANGNLDMNVGAHVNETNILYGGNKPYGTTKIVFVNGSIDPWHSLSVTSNFNPTVSAIYINGTAHCADANPPNSLSPPSLPKAQQQISQQIGQWLQEGNQ